MLLKDDKDLIAPTFQPDWKDADREEAERQFGHAPERPEHLLLVRTAIDRQRGYSEESKLFAPECTDVPGYVWCADIDLNDVHPNDENARREVTENLLDLLAGGLPDLGKTRARARVEVRERPFFDTSVAPEPLDDIEPGKDTWIVLLRTAARLLPARLEEKRIPPTGGADDLLSAYGDYWKRALDDRLALRHYYAQQEMVGGPYYWRHFRAREDYRPEWLTLAGSVFVLQSASADRKAVQHHLTHWLQGGLPKAEDRHQDDWRGNPYLGQATARRGRARCSPSAGTPAALLTSPPVACAASCGAGRRSAPRSTLRHASRFSAAPAGRARTRRRSPPAVRVP